MNSNVKREIESFETYNNRVHKIGRITLFSGLLLTFLFPLIIWLVYDIVPSKEVLMSSFVSISSVMLPTAIIELVSYAPLIGSSGMYIMSLTGSYLSIRIPSAVAAMESAGVENGSEEAELISTIGMVTSVFVSITVLVLSVLLMVPLQPIISSPALKPAFDTVLPALFGSLTIGILLKNVKYCILPLVLGFLVINFNLVPSTFHIPAMVVLSLIGNRILYKLKLI